MAEIGKVFSKKLQDYVLINIDNVLVVRKSEDDKDCLEIEFLNGRKLVVEMNIETFYVGNY